MEIRKFQASDATKLFSYWGKTGAEIPYFFPVSISKWQACLLEDELDGEEIFKNLETHFVTVEDQIIGFVQYGQPNFAWKENGGKYHNPDIGVIRHLYYDQDQPNAGEILIQKAKDYLERFSHQYAFYHILGMSCNAHHGKLHQSLSHVEQLLFSHGFSIEHENYYYVLDMQTIEPQISREFHLVSTYNKNEISFEVQQNEHSIGTAKVFLMDKLTDGYARDAVYLRWISMKKQHQDKGIGKEFLHLLISYLQNKGYRYLHTDTANTNTRAQRFYLRENFQSKGLTRNYIKQKNVPNK